MLEDFIVTATSSEVFSIYEEFTTVLLKIIILSNTVVNSSYIEKTSEEVAVTIKSSNILN